MTILSPSLMCAGTKILISFVVIAFLKDEDAVCPFTTASASLTSTIIVLGSLIPTISSAIISR